MRGRKEKKRKRAGLLVHAYDDTKKATGASTRAKEEAYGYAPWLNGVLRRGAKTWSRRARKELVLHGAVNDRPERKGRRVPSNSVRDKQAEPKESLSRKNPRLAGGRGGTGPIKNASKRTAAKQGGEGDRGTTISAKTRKQSVATQKTLQHKGKKSGSTKRKQQGNQPKNRQHSRKGKKCTKRGREM